MNPAADNLIPSSESVTELLARWPEGHEIHSRLMPLVYSDLRRLAGALFAKERMDHTLQATSLVNEAYIRLVGSGPFDDRNHFFGAAANAMRRVLVDHARRHCSAKRGGLLDHVELDDQCASTTEECGEILAVHGALSRLEALDHRQHELVKLRYFAGLTLREAADVLGIGLSTAKEDWSEAKAWLKKQLEM
jgi:RNA polymerase sigma factor (TIGR02999 family)